tara:strand:+ start:387 stop:872 length:486 start_codon:yes stop_codon:yes gene_type:complete
MKKPIKYCIICANLLKGSQKKYCSRTCADYQTAQTQNKKTKELGKKKCLVCKTSFFPVRTSNIYCSKDCLQKVHAKQRRLGNILNIVPNKLKIHKHSKPHFNQNCSDNKIAIKAYLKNGGKISTLPIAPTGKAPDVNFKYAWVPTEIYGNGLLYDMGEEHE